MKQSSTSLVMREKQIKTILKTDWQYHTLVGLYSYCNSSWGINGYNCFENQCSILLEFHIHIPHHPAIVLYIYIYIHTTEIHANVHQNKCIKMFIGKFTHNSQNQKTIQISSTLKWISSGLFIHLNILQWKWTNSRYMHGNMDGWFSQIQNSEWKEVRYNQMYSYISIYIKPKNRQNWSVTLKDRLVITTGKEAEEGASGVQQCSTSWNRY